MVILVGEVQLFLPESQSLKQKRQVLSSLKERLHNRFNLSVAEVDHGDLWQRSTIALAVVSVNSSMFARVPGPADLLAIDATISP